MSQPSLESASVPSVITKKGVLDVYTVMLIIALVCLLMGCIFLWLEIGEYGGYDAVKGPLALISNPMSGLFGGAGV